MTEDFTLKEVLFPVRGMQNYPHKIYLRIAGCLGEGSQDLFDGLASFHNSVSVKDGITNKIREQAHVVFGLGFVQIGNI